MEEEMIAVNVYAGMLLLVTEAGRGIDTRLLLLGCALLPVAPVPFAPETILSIRGRGGPRRW